MITVNTLVRGNADGTRFRKFDTVFVHFSYIMKVISCLCIGYDVNHVSY